ncbi:MAG: universal stress protein, partial [Planctomycetes bacterium]|nr:universal stress protein [Planctomycetota bacterium]
MIGFGKIMVGVDWKEAGPEDRFGLSVNGYEAVSVGVAVAAAIDAEVTFVSILDCVDESSPDWNETAVDDRIRPDLDKRLIALAEYASQHGAAARACVCYGTAWLELVREVLRESYDLVILGARDSTPDRPLGNLALKVLRNSPAPVWVTRPRPNPDDLFVLVPTDLSDDSLDTLYAAVYLGQITDSKTRVLHAVPAEAAAAE